MLLLGLAAVVVALAAATVAAPASAEDGTAAAVTCPGPDETSLAAVECAGIEPIPDLDPADTPEVLAAAAARSTEATALAPECRYHSEAVFYAAADWMRLVRLLSENTSFCADFYVSVPPLVADKRKPRPAEAARISAFGPRFHPMGEIHYATWSKSVGVDPETPTYYDAGVKAGRVFAAAGYQTWALNEFGSAVRQGQPNERAHAAQFVVGLRDGSGVGGLVFVTGVGQLTSPLDVYRGNLQNWLLDSLFWSSLSDAVRFWAQEVYGDVRAWAVPGASRNERTRHLADYLMHGENLAESLGDAAAPARALLRRTYVPLGNLAWRWPTSFGWTDIDYTLMESYVSEQVFAVRHYAGANPQLAPEGRFGAAYAPRPSAPVDAVGNGAILERLASALHEAYEEGGHSQTGACGPPGGHDWCAGELDGGAFVDGWESFGG